MNVEEAKIQLKEKGYCSFNLVDFDDSLIQYIEKYKCNDIISLKDKMINLRADYKNPYELEGSQNINKQFSSFEHTDSAKWEILNREDINRKDFFQIWLYNNLQDDGVKRVFDKITKYFFDLDESEQLQIEIQNTMYNKGCFLQDHTDGKSPVKNYASILIYLNENYNENWGGNLILKGNDDMEYLVLPEFGKVAMIDLQNFDIHHQVTEVIADVERCTLVSFPFNKKYVK